MIDGIGEDVRLTVATASGPVLDMTLTMAAISARYAGTGELLPFLYRPPVDPENPDEPRELRRAVLAIVDDAPVSACDNTAALRH